MFSQLQLAISIIVKYVVRNLEPIAAIDHFGITTGTSPLPPRRFLTLPWL